MNSFVVSYIKTIHTNLLFMSIIVCSIVVLVGCGEQPDSSKNEIAIHIFQYGNPAVADVHPSQDENVLLSDISGNTNGWLPLKQIDLSKSDIVIGENDIQRYHWNDDDRKIAQLIELSDDIHKRIGYQAESEQQIPFEGYFVMAMGDEVFVGGLLRFEGSAMAVKSPTLYSSYGLRHEGDKGNSDPAIEADHYFWLQRGIGDPYNGKTAGYYFNDINPNLREHLQQIGLLVE